MKPEIVIRKLLESIASDGRTATQAKNLNLQSSASKNCVVLVLTTTPSTAVFRATDDSDMAERLRNYFLIRCKELAIPFSFIESFCLMRYQKKRETSFRIMTIIALSTTDNSNPVLT
jgi:hypothetical protein